MKEMKEGRRPIKKRPKKRREKCAGLPQASPDVFLAFPVRLDLGGGRVSAWTSAEECFARGVGAIFRANGRCDDSMTPSPSPLTKTRTQHNHKTTLTLSLAQAHSHVHTGLPAKLYLSHPALPHSIIINPSLQARSNTSRGQSRQHVKHHDQHHRPRLLGPHTSTQKQA